MKKIVTMILILGLTAAMLSGCGGKGGTADGADASANLTGSCEEILAKVYEKAELDADLREAMEYYQTTSIDETSEEYILGTTDIDYTDAVYSAPMMSSVAYQCVLLRVSEDQDVEAAKQSLKDNADPRKWICVEAESVVVENVGDTILFIMADKPAADAVKTAFLSLSE